MSLYALSGCTGRCWQQMSKIGTGVKTIFKSLAQFILISAAYNVNPLPVLITAAVSIKYSNEINDFFKAKLLPLLNNPWKTTAGTVWAMYLSPHVTILAGCIGYTAHTFSSLRN